jgi:hypothetical protein
MSVGPESGQEPTLVTIGDIAVSQHWVSTSSGTASIGSTTWTVTPMYQTTRSIPTWAIVCAVVFFVFCFLGLLFLLVKEEQTTGYVQVVVQSQGLVHSCYVPVYSPQQAVDVAARVDYARSLAAASTT